MKTTRELQRALVRSGIDTAGAGQDYEEGIKLVHIVDDLRPFLRERDLPEVNTWYIATVNQPAIAGQRAGAILTPGPRGLWLVYAGLTNFSGTSGSVLHTPTSPTLTAGAAVVPGARFGDTSKEPEATLNIATAVAAQAIGLALNNWTTFMPPPIPLRPLFLPAGRVAEIVGEAVNETCLACIGWSERPIT